VDKQRINPPSVFRSLDHGFSQGVAASGRTTLYVSGQTAWDANRKLVGGSDLKAQARQALLNVQRVVEAGGGTLADVVSLRIYVVAYEGHKAQEVGGAFLEFFSGDDAAPASTWVGVAALADPRFLIEIEAIAVFD
jgi:2-iminobutanoate/2-iminopropanoate deaminase